MKRVHVIGMSRVIGLKAPPELKRAAQRAVEADGLAATAKRIGIATNTLVRILAGDRVYPGSLALARQGLVELPQGES